MVYYCYLFGLFVWSKRRDVSLRSLVSPTFTRVHPIPAGQIVLHTTLDLQG